MLSSFEKYFIKQSFDELKRITQNEILRRIRFDNFSNRSYYKVFEHLRRYRGIEIYRIRNQKTFHPLTIISQFKNPKKIKIFDYTLDIPPTSYFCGLYHYNVYLRLISKFDIDLKIKEKENKITTVLKILEIKPNIRGFVINFNPTNPISIPLRRYYSFSKNANDLNTIYKYTLGSDFREFEYKLKKGKTIFKGIFYKTPKVFISIKPYKNKPLNIPSFYYFTKDKVFKKFIDKSINRIKNEIIKSLGIKIRRYVIWRTAKEI